MSELAAKQCVPCRGGVPPLAGEASSRRFSPALGPNGWQVVSGHHLEKSYTFADFSSALAFVNRVGAVAEEQGHHPDIYLGWGKVRITVWTHKIEGLTESDFILAAKADQVALRRDEKGPGPLARSGALGFDADGAGLKPASGIPCEMPFASARGALRFAPGGTPRRTPPPSSRVCHYPLDHLLFWTSRSSGGTHPTRPPEPSELRRDRRRPGVGVRSELRESEPGSAGCQSPPRAVLRLLAGPARRTGHQAWYLLEKVGCFGVRAR